MNGRDINKKNSKRQKTYLKCFLLGAFALIIIVGFGATAGSSFVKAESNTASASIQRKYYKSIEIESGDTLWAIAKEFRGDHYDSIYDYIDEVMDINGLKTDEIHAGQYLTIPYYDSL
ncbi:MAG: LysM peptidoglycan-binding domain-containing protein [Lachnospiraceae bacterium]